MIRALLSVVLMVAILALALVDKAHHTHQHTTLIVALAAIQVANVVLYFAARRRP